MDEMPVIKPEFEVDESGGGGGGGMETSPLAHGGSLYDQSEQGEAVDSSEPENDVIKPETQSRRSSGSDSSERAQLTPLDSTASMPGSGEPSLLGPIRREQQKRRSKPKEKGSSYVCGVCSDRALGYNFDAITCESCKAFFRRNAVKKKELVCSFDGNCTIDPHSRKFCPACRLKKCFDIGMKREWILTDEQLQKRRMKAQVRRLNLANQSGCYPSSSAPLIDPTASMLPSHRSPTNPAHLSSGLAARMGSFSAAMSQSGGMMPLHVQPGNKPFSPEMTNGSEQEFLSPVTSDTKPPVFSSEALDFNSSTSHPVDLSALSHLMPNIVTSPSVESAGGSSRSGGSPGLYTPPSTPSSSYSHPMAQHLNTQKLDQSPALVPVPGQQPAPLAKDDKRFRQLDLEEHAFLGGILKSYKSVFESPIPDQFTEAFQLVEALSDIWNLTDCFIRRLIKFAKHFDEFRSLEQEDQIALLKGGVIELLSLRSVFSFNPKHGDFILDSTKLGPNSIAVDIRKAESQIPKPVFEQMSQHFQFMQQAMASTNTDPLTLILLMVIELFSPDRVNLSNKEAVSKAQERYSCLLRRYLENKFGFDEAQQMFPKLLILLMRVRERGQVGSQILENCDVSTLRPLVIEMIGQFGNMTGDGVGAPGAPPDARPQATE